MMLFPDVGCRQGAAFDLRKLIRILNLQKKSRLPESGAVFAEVVFV